MPETEVVDDLISGLLAYNLHKQAARIFAHLDAKSLRACLWTCTTWRHFLLGEVGSVRLADKEREEKIVASPLGIALRHRPEDLLSPEHFCQFSGKELLGASDFLRNFQWILRACPERQMPRHAFFIGAPLVRWEVPKPAGGASRLCASFRDLLLYLSPCNLTLYRLAQDRFHWRLVALLSLPLKKVLHRHSDKKNPRLNCWLRSVGSRAFIVAAEAGVVGGYCVMCDSDTGRVLWTRDTRTPEDETQGFGVSCVDRKSKVAFHNDNFCGIVDLRAVGSCNSDERKMCVAAIDYAVSTADDQSTSFTRDLAELRSEETCRDWDSGLNGALFSHTSSNHAAVFMQCRQPKGGSNLLLLPCSIWEMSNGSHRSVLLALATKERDLLRFQLSGVAMHELSGRNLQVVAHLNGQDRSHFFIFHIGSRIREEDREPAFPVKAGSFPGTEVIGTPMPALGDHQRLWTLTKLKKKKEGEDTKSLYVVKVKMPLHPLILGRQKIKIKGQKTQIKWRRIPLVPSEEKKKEEDKDWKSVTAEQLAKTPSKVNVGKFKNSTKTSISPGELMPRAAKIHALFVLAAVLCAFIGTAWWKIAAK